MRFTRSFRRMSIRRSRRWSSRPSERQVNDYSDSASHHGGRDHAARGLGRGRAPRGQYLLSGIDLRLARGLLGYRQTSQGLRFGATRSGRVAVEENRKLGRRRKQQMTWKTAFRQTDTSDPSTGEPLYVYARIRPHWYWVVQRIELFMAIVWRVADRAHDGSVYRLSVRTAWDVSKVAMGPEQ